MIRKKYALTGKTNSQCPMKDAFRKMFEETLSSGSLFVPVKTIIGDKDNGYFSLCMDEPDIDRMYGYLISCTDEEGNSMSESELEDMIADENYEIRITSISGNKLEGELIVHKAENSASGKTDSAISSELRALVEEKINEGVAEREDIYERIAVMKMNHVDEFLITRVVKGYRKYSKAPKKPDCIYVDPFLENSLKRHEEPLVSEILRCAVDRYGMVFEGEKSVGKNVAAATVAWLLGMPMRLFTCSRQLTPSSLYGDKTTDNSAMEALKSKEAIDFARSKVYAERNGRPDEGTIEEAAMFELLKARAAATNIIIEDSELVDWLIDGGILVLNEMNLCEPNLLASFLNPILDGTGFLTIQGRGEVPVNPDCVLIGTQNSDYVGTEEQNEATLSRLGFEFFKQPEIITGLLDEAAKAEVKKHGFEGVAIDGKWLDQTNRFYGQCRQAMEKGLISNAVLNIRGFARALSAVAESDGRCRLKRQIQFHVINGCPISERGALNDMLESCVTS